MLQLLVPSWIYMQNESRGKCDDVIRVHGWTWLLHVESEYNLNMYVKTLVKLTDVYAQISKLLNRIVNGV